MVEAVGWMGGGGGYGGGGSASHESYFRFIVDGMVFRLLLLSKDKQSQLKITTYDFLLIGVQVRKAFENCFYVGFICF